jgi:uncharacterized membrane protein
MDSTSFATAYALSTSIGLRPFLTLALASLAMHFGYLHPSTAFGYLGSDTATWILAALAAAEFVADKIPVVDHGFHLVHFATKPVAAALLVGSMVPDGGSIDAGTYALMALGGLNALGVHSGVTAVRAASTTMTLGTANPFVSLLEDVAAAGGTLLALALPWAAAVLAAFLTFLVFVVVRRLYLEVRRRRATALT